MDNFSSQETHFYVDAAHAFVKDTKARGFIPVTRSILMWVII